MSLGDLQKHIRWGEALKQMWRENPCSETQVRYSGYVKLPMSSKNAWIAWVESSAAICDNRSDWRPRLVGMVVALKLAS